ncbi:MAG: aconitate hydratase AcnA [Dehalococcoidia bacterium]
MFNSTNKIISNEKEYFYESIHSLEKLNLVEINKTPYSIRVLLENVLRSHTRGIATKDHVELVSSWRPNSKPSSEFPFMPGRVLLQDFTGVPVVVDIAAMRDAVKEIGGDPSIINPIVRSDMVIDHSVQVDNFSNVDSLKLNVDREFERNTERYKLLKWAQSAFNNLRIIPPSTGIVHQVNLEYLAEVILLDNESDKNSLMLDSCVGTDSHTTMINGLGVLGWGVGGIEAEAVMLGQPYYMVLPEVVGVRLVGELPEGSTATDLVLSIVEKLRSVGVVEKFVEFYGPSLHKLPLADRATIANMAPEYGATCGFFPIDDQTIKYLQDTGRDKNLINRVESFSKTNAMFYDKNSEPSYSQSIDFDMSDVTPSLAGPKRPQDKISLKDIGENFSKSFDVSTDKKYEIDIEKNIEEISNSSVVIAAITSCTNTSNPYVMVGAGLLARKAREKGLNRKPWVKSSLAPGSTVVTEYLNQANLSKDLDFMGFNTVGYGCTTCIGNSGPLPQAVADTVSENDLTVAAVLSGNRNFEGRVHPQVKANYLASPILVVAFAIAGTVDIDLVNEPIGSNDNGDLIFLKDIWPSQNEISDVISKSIKPEIFNEQYSSVIEGPEAWKKLETSLGLNFNWDLSSTYIQKPPYFDNFSQATQTKDEILSARVLVSLADSVTTDHISPAGSIPPSAPAGQFLLGNDVARKDYNSFGSRRGNHDVMVRGTFGNIRLRNNLCPDMEGDWTIHFPSDEKMRIFDASEKYRLENTPLIVFAGKEYGTGSSRDWAAKGPMLLGVRAVIAESYERIHRSNLVGMGVLPLQFMDNQSMESLELDGSEFYDIPNVANEVEPRSIIEIHAKTVSGKTKKFNVLVRIDTAIENEYYKNGGLLPFVLRKMIKENS